jgi:hypothetical protein
MCSFRVDRRVIRLDEVLHLEVRRVHDCSKSSALIDCAAQNFVDDVVEVGIEAVDAYVIPRETVDSDGSQRQKRVQSC